MANANRITLSGQVQGVGFRPFVYRLASEYELTGYVQNRLGEVDVLACGSPDALQRFRKDLIDRAPPLSQPSILRCDDVDANGYDTFEIKDSAAGAEGQSTCLVDDAIAGPTLHCWGEETNASWGAPTALSSATVPLCLLYTSDAADDDYTV